MNRIAKAAVLVGLMATASACTRIETGEVGVRRSFDKTIETTELMPGSVNQTIFGDVMTFPTKDVQVDVSDLTPLASDNSTVADFDMAVIYSINPTSVAELYKHPKQKAEINGVFYHDVFSTKFRVKMTSYTSGTVTVTGFSSRISK